MLERKTGMGTGKTGRRIASYILASRADILSRLLFVQSLKLHVFVLCTEIQRPSLFTRYGYELDWLA